MEVLLNHVTWIKSWKLFKVNRKLCMRLVYFNVGFLEAIVFITQRDISQANNITCKLRTFVGILDAILVMNHGIPRAKIFRTIKPTDSCVRVEIQKYRARSHTSRRIWTKSNGPTQDDMPICATYVSASPWSDPRFEGYESVVTTKRELRSYLFNARTFSRGNGCDLATSTVCNSCNVGTNRNLLDKLKMRCEGLGGAKPQGSSN